MEKRSKTRKSYQPPTLTNLTPEEAKLKLLDAAKQGDKEAKELLESIYCDKSEKEGVA